MPPTIEQANTITGKTNSERLLRAIRESVLLMRSITYLLNQTRQPALWLRHFAAHRIQNAVDELHRFLAGELARQLQRLVYGHRRRRAATRHFVHRQTQDISLIH